MTGSAKRRSPGPWPGRRWRRSTGTADPETPRLVDQLRADAMGPGTPAPAAAPDIIFVTSESFFDVTRLPGLTFSQDPLPNFHRLSETCTNGPFLSNTYGGGTAGKRAWSHSHPRRS